MMSNVSGVSTSQASTPVVVAKNYLKQAETKGYHFQNKKNKIMSAYLKQVTHKMEFSPNGHMDGKNEIKDD